MRRTLTTAATAALLALLTACSGSSSPAAKAAPTRSKPSPSAQFLASVAQSDIESWATAKPDDGELLTFPPKWCAALAQGHSVSYILGVRNGMYPAGAEWGTEQGDAEKLVLVGVAAYCPAQSASVQQQLRDSGDY